MLPAVPEQLQALRTRMAETIVPALRDDAAFAQEQAALMLGTLDWLIAVQADQYLYEVVENRDHLGLAVALRDLVDGDGQAAAGQSWSALLDDEPASAAHVVDLGDLRERNRRLKALSAQLFKQIGAGGHPDHVARATQAMGAVARRQERRERSFYQMTGFPVGAEDLGAVLREQFASS